jgi:hypothetical protein
MRRGRIFLWAAAVIATALVWIPGGIAGSSGGSPAVIARDLSDGVLNGKYSQSELQRYFRDATQQGYPTVTTTTGAAAGEVAGTNQEGGGQQPIAVNKAVPATQTKGTLPFTGAQLGLFAIVGLALVAMGFLLRTTARQKASKPRS